MKALSSCKEAMEQCISLQSFAIAHLHKEEKTMKMHIHDSYEIYFSISGGKQFLVDNRLYTIDPGDVFVINPYESHYITQVDKAVHERIVISVYPEFLKSLSTKDTDLAYCLDYRPPQFSHKLSLKSDQQKRFLYFINKITSSQGYGQDLIEKIAFTELMLLLNTAYRSNLGLVTESIAEIKSSETVDQILSYINKNIHTNVSLEELAAHFYLSESYLCRIFKAVTGMSINKYITARRISIAKALLAEGHSVREVSLQCGYKDYSNFAKAFTKTVGLPPKKYAIYSAS